MWRAARNFCSRLGAALPAASVTCGNNGGTMGTVGGAMVGYAAGRSYDQHH
ncbi:MAG TPA: hypothetical protein VE935_15545 [Burkholderiales bacterium]|jgi:hypothetical protein|nr:hypothetical protein [Burkholderiales bacterium]